MTTIFTRILQRFAMITAGMYTEDIYYCVPVYKIVPDNNAYIKQVEDPVLFLNTKSNIIFQLRDFELRKNDQ